MHDRSQRIDPNMAHPPVSPIIALLTRAFTWVVHVVARDHSSLYGGWYTRGQAGWRNLYVCLACAPSRRFRRPRPVSPTAALDLLREVLPDGLAAPPTESTSLFVAYEVADDPSGPTPSEPLRAGRVWANGRVELFVRVGTVDADDGRLCVDLLEAIVPLQRLAASVRNGAYAHAYGQRTRFRRLDWFVFLGNVLSSDEGTRHWEDLIFSGRRPRTRATRAYGAAPHLGLAWKELRSRRQRTAPTVLVRAVVYELLRDSGWDGTDEAIADTLDALRATTAPATA